MDDRPKVRPRRTHWWVRGALVAMAAFLVMVFATATQVVPYAADGTPLRMGSHQTIGLPPCQFQRTLDIPCPSCGMTTSFAFLVRGDLWNSIRANWVGTGLAVFCAALVPWALVSAVRGRFLFIRQVDTWIGFLIGAFTILMLARWGLVLLVQWLG